MIRITAELWPYGSKIDKKVLGAITINNDGTGNEEIGNYNVAIGDDKGVVERCRVEGFKRLNNDVFDLLYEALKNMREGGCE